MNWGPARRVRKLVWALPGSPNPSSQHSHLLPQRSGAWGHPILIRKRSFALDTLGAHHALSLRSQITVTCQAHSSKLDPRRLTQEEEEKESEQAASPTCPQAMPTREADLSWSLLVVAPSKFKSVFNNTLPQRSFFSFPVAIIYLI